MDEYNSKRKVVVVTGGSAGVGRATVRAFAKLGADVAILARGKDGLEGAKEDVEAMGGRALAIEVDVADAQAVEAAAEKIENELGEIDIWVNNAMASVFSTVKEMKSEEYKRVTEVTYLGQVYGTLSVLKRMLPRNRGTIIFVGSALAYRGIPLQSAYCAAKHASQGFYDSLRCELIHDKSDVKIAMVHLPALNTPQFDWVKSRLPNKGKPMGKIFQPEVAADAIVYAADSDEREVWVGSPTLMSILGNKVAPGFLDHYLAKTGYKGQQTDEPRDEDAPDNLWEPLPGDHGAHGRFDDKAHESSTEFTLAKNKWTVLGIGVAVITGIVGARLISRAL